MKLLDSEQLGTFAYPNYFTEIINRGLIDFEPWVIMEGEYLQTRFEGLKKRYHQRSLIPFARRLDNDDIACWDVQDNQKVIIVHDFASPGWEQGGVYDSFWDWFKQAIEDMIEFIQ